MKTLYLDCGMGAAGDMLTAALLELLPDPENTVAELNALGIPGVSFAAQTSFKCGIKGTHMQVLVNGEEEGEAPHHASEEEHEHEHEEHHHEHEHDHEHPHEHLHEHEHSHEHGHEHHHGRHLSDIEALVRAFSVPESVKSDVLAVYRLIAEAESAAHGKSVTEIHFHEVGTLDAIADVTAVCLLMHKLSPDEVVVSPIHVGSGHVHCAHGILPVPAPATAYILKDCPIYGGQIRGELCTPTGAALLKHFATRFGALPLMRTSAIGYGMGKKDFEQANCIRAMLGETEGSRDSILELSFNVDDMTAEAIAYATAKLMEGGARDVYTIPIGMKKNRPGTLIRVMCTAEEREKMLSLIFRHSTTIGVRESVTNRFVLDRREDSVPTVFGPVRRKISSGYGVTRCKYEFEDLKRIAEEQGLSLTQVVSKLPALPGEENI